MLPTFTLKKRHYGNFLLLMTALVLLPFAVQSQNTDSELEDKMKSLYNHASQLYANMPTRDYRGSYLNFTFGISPLGHIKTWRTEEICDCEGNVIETKDVPSIKAPISLGIGFETRVSKLFSLRLMGSYAQLSHGKGRKVVAENNTFSQMQQNYKLTQFGAQSSALIHFNNFYSGIGASYTSSNASGFQTTAQKEDIKPPQYYNLQAAVLGAHQTDLTPHVFIGYRVMASPKVLGSFEFGFAQSFYFNVQINIPLSSRTRESLATWKRERQHYTSALKEAILLDMQLHPAKFQTDDCTPVDNSSSNNCNR